MKDQCPEAGRKDAERHFPVFLVRTALCGSHNLALCGSRIPGTQNPIQKQDASCVINNSPGAKIKFHGIKVLGGPSGARGGSHGSVRPEFSLLSGRKSPPSSAKAVGGLPLLFFRQQVCRFLLVINALMNNDFRFLLL